MISSTFETLPDEILMIIIQYSGDVYNIFRTYSRLNQRLNNILIDRRLHLLTDFLYISPNDVNFDYYYKSAMFNDIYQQLSSLTTIENNKQLRQCFQSLVTFHIGEKFNQLKDEYQLNKRQFQSIRENLSGDEILNLDQELLEIFKSFDKRFESTAGGFHVDDPIFLGKHCRLQAIKYIKDIEYLILSKGARPEINFAHFMNT